jgi:hypothetical protein
VSEEVARELRLVRLVVENSVERLEPLPAKPEHGGGDGGGSGHMSALPEGCPVIPLGTRGGMKYFLDEIGQARDVKRLERLEINDLFGRKIGLLYDYWPRVNDTGKAVGVRYEKAAEALAAACAHKGIWNPFERIHGRGAWLGVDGQLVLHCGDAVLDGGSWRSPGIFGRHVLPAGEPIMHPWNDPVSGGAHGPATELLSMLRTWNWRRGELDARLVVGWIATAMLAGALKWRPVLWVTGAKNTGKSTLQELLKAIFDGALLAVADPTGAGIWQTTKYDTLPIALDEREAEEDPRQQQALVKLARLASGGGLILRGGADHSAEKFIARSCFLFSSIRVPPLLAQDRSRIAICALGALPREASAPSLKPGALAKIGRQLLRRLVDGWPRLPQALEQYRIALLDHGHNARGVDVFGTLLAAADLLLSDGDVDADTAAELASKLDVSILPEADDDASDEQRWLHLLLSSVVPLDGAGAKNSVAEWIRQALKHQAFDAPRIEADRVLANVGIKIIRPKTGAGAPVFFAIANAHTGLDKLHVNTHWAGRSGAAGVWVQAARDLPGAQATLQRFAGPPTRGTMIPLELVIAAGDKGDGHAPVQAALEVEEAES